MNRINTIFENSKSRKLLSLYFCAGATGIDTTLPILKAIEKSCVDFVEIGIPFSDPLADGPVIQDAATKALKNGMTLRILFDQLKDVRKTITMPLIMMGYLNPIMQYGFEAFCDKCQQCGVDGVIIPDLPFSDYINEYKAIADNYDIRIIMLITPETSEERIRLIDEHTDGFIYMVSSASTTGAQKVFDENKLAYFNRVEAMNLRNPRMIGFGISNYQTLHTAQQNSAGAIIGSRFVTLLEESETPEIAIEKLMNDLAEK